MSGRRNGRQFYNRLLNSALHERKQKEAEKGQTQADSGRIQWTGPSGAERDRFAFTGSAGRQNGGGSGSGTEKRTGRGRRKARSREAVGETKRGERRRNRSARPASSCKKAGCGTVGRRSLFFRFVAFRLQKFFYLCAVEKGLVPKCGRSGGFLPVEAGRSRFGKIREKRFYKHIRLWTRKI